jgi:hypothetical protein
LEKCLCSGFVAAILGTVLPLSQLIPFLTAHGLNMPLFFRQLFQNQVSGFFGMDVIVSSFVLWLFVFSEGRRRGLKNLWLYVACNLVVGVSLALPIFLFFRARKLKTR